MGDRTYAIMFIGDDMGCKVKRRHSRVGGWGREMKSGRGMMHAAAGVKDLDGLSRHRLVAIT